MNWVNRMFLFVKKYGKWRGKLISEYVLLTIFVVCIVAISFFATVHIVNSSAMEQSRQSLDVIFQQAEERIKILEDDIESLHLNVIHNDSIVEFFRAKNVAERWDNLSGFYQVVGNNRRLNRNLQNVVLYDTAGNLIASKGDVYLPRAEEIARKGMYLYSNRMLDSRTGEVYFEVGMPVFQENRGSGYSQIGSVYLLFDVKYLQAIVDGTLPNEDSAVGILDRNGNLVVGAGSWKEEYASLTEAMEDDDNLIYVSPIKGMDWRMTGVVPKKSMLSGVTQIQKLNYITYLIVLFAMGLVCHTLYKRIILPISRQTAFMANFTQDTGQRIEVIGNNEISEMARKMNEMLDDIETLNREIIDSQKRYLELEYAKKQTEMIAYKSQINPHFLYNTFNCLHGMALYKGEKEIAELIMSLSCFFRYSVQGDEMVTIHEAMKNLQHYANIIHHRFRGKHRVTVEVADPVLHVKIPKLLIQPLVENAVLHGLETKLDGGIVHIRASVSGRNLEIVVQDNGDGMEEEKLWQLRDAMAQYDRDETLTGGHPGIGFLNVYRRMRLFYGQDAVFELESRKGEGTRIRMLLPAG